jgi:2-desacetyl-2-hydroxyethyl bacteriochlorophyllide A dehydrogenase
MKAVWIKEAGKVTVIEREIPAPGEGELLVRVNYVGFCGSDLSTYLGKNPLVSYPRVPGHEISGVIVELGRQVPDDFSLGEPVTVIPYTSCGKCPSCRIGRYNACRDNQTLGVQRDGAMQEFIVVPWQKIIRAPVLGEKELAMVEPLTVGFHAIERGRVTEQDVVMVLGCGMIGAGAIVASLQKGATVIAVDVDDHKLELASLLGAHHVLHSRISDLHETLLRLTGGDGPDVVIEAAGTPLTYKQAVEEVSFCGRVVCIGYAGGEVSFNTRLFVQKEIDILGSRNATPEDFKTAILYLEKGTFPVDRMITDEAGPAYASRAMKEWAADPGRVMKILLDFKS